MTRGPVTPEELAAIESSALVDLDELSLAEVAARAEELQDHVRLLIAEVRRLAVPP